MPHRNLLWLAVALCVLVATRAAHATVIVSVTVAPMGGLFHYDYSITNDPPSPGVDVILVDVNVLPMDATLTNLFAPAGFLTVYDFGLGKVSFLPDFGSPDLFEVGATHSGFGFNSPRLPGASTFDALTLLGDTVSGPTQAPLGAIAAPVPEPATVTLLLVGLGPLVAFTVRKRYR
jgi:hypothetical protein